MVYCRKLPVALPPGHVSVLISSQKRAIYDLKRLTYLFRDPNMILLYVCLFCFDCFVCTAGIVCLTILLILLFQRVWMHIKYLYNSNIVDTHKYTVQITIRLILLTDIFTYCFCPHIFSLNNMGKVRKFSPSTYKYSLGRKIKTLFNSNFNMKFELPRTSDNTNITITRIYFSFPRRFELTYLL